MLTLENVCRTYDVGGEVVKALDNVNIHIGKGEFVAIIGPSGSGKSTLMNIIGCLDIASSGRYILDGIEIEKYTDDQLAEIRNKKIGFIFQNFNLLNKLTAEENVELPLIYQGMKEAERKVRVKDALEKVGIYYRRNHTPLELSGGQQQRVAVARALASKPSLLLADEPTGNLDSKTTKDIMDLFHELHEEGNTIVLITHDNEIAKQGSRQVRILDGKCQEVSL
ncbi:MAG: ABC transporter ATP-binding protein [Bacillota bacterium]